jgi:hypothetical protein
VLGGIKFCLQKTHGQEAKTYGWPRPSQETAARSKKVKKGKSQAGLAEKASEFAQNVESIAKNAAEKVRKAISGLIF